MSASLSHSATSWVPPGRNAGQAAPSGADICSAEAARGAAGGRAGGGGSAARMLPLPPSGAAGCAQCLSCPTGRLGVTPQPPSSICTSFSRAAGRWDTHRSPPPPPYPTCPSDPALCLPITGWFCPQPCTESRLVVLFPCTCIAQSTHSRRGGLSALPDPFSALGFLQGAKKSHSWPGAFLWQQLSHPVLQLPSQRHPSICSTSGSLLSVLL